jgi:hypothetical protein
MRYSFSDHEGKVVCIHGELTDKYLYETYRMIKDVSLAAPIFNEEWVGGIINRESIVKNASDHLWLSKTVMNSGLYHSPLYNQKFYLGKVSRYKRNNNTIDFGLEPISRKEYLVNIVRIFVSPMCSAIMYLRGMLPYVDTMKNLDRESGRKRTDEEILESTFQALKEGHRIFEELNVYYTEQKLQFEDIKLKEEVEKAGLEFIEACEIFFKWREKVNYLFKIYSRKLQNRDKKKRALSKIKSRNTGGFGKQCNSNTSQP